MVGRKNEGVIFVNFGIEHRKPDKRMFCKVKPELSQCSYCNETAQMFDIIPDCNTCKVKNREYEIMEIVHGFFGTYAIVYDPEQKILTKASMSRLYDVRY